MSSKTEEKEESNIIPVTVFVNQKLMDSKPIERLRGMKFDRLKIECVSDDNDGGDDDDDTADNALGEKEKSVLPIKTASSESSSIDDDEDKEDFCVGMVVRQHRRALETHGTRTDDDDDEDDKKRRERGGGEV